MKRDMSSRSRPSDSRRARDGRGGVCGTAFKAGRVESSRVSGENANGFVARSAERQYAMMMNVSIKMNLREH
jgi:hypothetical protein